MKAEELRVGSLAFRLLFDANNKLIGKEPRIFTTADFNYLFLWEPIPLTEEILLKAGLEKQEGEADYLSDYEIKKVPYKYFDNNLLFIIYRDNKWAVSKYIDRNMNTTASLRDIEYLHELQNLIFALTGKELEVKL
jgi:hypothetical protein